MESPRLDPLFNPRSIALIGASTSPRKWGFIILLNILKGNYSGRIFPVNPKAESILGYPCYASVKDLPETVDLAIITTPAAVVPPLIDECGHMKIPFVVVIIPASRNISGRNENWTKRRSSRLSMPHRSITRAMVMPKFTLLLSNFTRQRICQIG